MGKKLAIGLGSAFLVFLIVFCLVPLKQVSSAATESYQDPETYYVSEPYTTRIPYTVRIPYIENGETMWRTVTEYQEVTMYKDVPEQTNIWKERPVTQYKKVPLLEYFIGY